MQDEYLESYHESLPKESIEQIEMFLYTFNNFVEKKFNISNSLCDIKQEL